MFNQEYSTVSQDDLLSAMKAALIHSKQAAIYRPVVVVESYPGQLEQLCKVAAAAICDGAIDV